MPKSHAFVVVPALLVAMALANSPTPAAEIVQTARVPDGGLQPQIAQDAKGVVHLIYLKGDAARSDIFYVRSSDGGKTWSAPIRVNSRAGSAVATGTVRGAHVAIGKDGRVHVAWMGARDAEPKAPGANTPMLYARSRDDGKSFEPQRNVITERVGLDGGGSVAADESGNVYVGWHAPTSKGAGEATRRVWVARSADEGKTFAAETALSPDPTGACGCCGMRLLAADGKLLALYRSATEMVHRDMYLLDASDPGRAGGPVVSTKLAPMEIGKCVMSTAAFTRGPKQIVAAWETDGVIEFGRIDPASGKLADRQAIPGNSGRRGGQQKHPAVAINAKGETLVAWAEGTGWNKGGMVTWQLFDVEGKMIAGACGKKDGLPAWSLPAAFAREDGSFVVLY